MKTNVIIDAKAIEDYNINDIEPYRPCPCFDTDHRGVWWINVRTGKDGEVIEAEPLLLSDPIDIIGTGPSDEPRVRKFPLSLEKSALAYPCADASASAYCGDGLPA